MKIDDVQKSTYLRRVEYRLYECFSGSGSFLGGLIASLKGTRERRLWTGRGMASVGIVRITEL
jgi:hypothetical protein